jgi:hypothetical protein
MSDYENLDRDQLYQLAKTRGLRGLSQANKAELLTALLAADESVADTEPPSASDEETGEDESDEETGEDQEDLSSLGPDPELADQVRRIRAASDDGLRRVLQQTDLPLHLRNIITAELGFRQRRQEELDRQNRLTTPIQRYRVTKGGRFVVPGMITELPVGSLLTETTHNLAEVRRQGIEFESATAVELGADQLGRQTSRVV